LFLVKKKKGRIFPSVLAVLILLVMLTQVPHSINLILRGHSKGVSALLDVLITGGLIAFNAYIIYVLYFSKEKAFFYSKTTGEKK